MCVAQCGVIAIVEDGRFTKVKPNIRQLSSHNETGD
jgi:hypothetical protein